MTSMPASCSAFTMDLHSPTCSPRLPVEEYLLCGARMPLLGAGELVVEQRLGPSDVTLDRLAVRVEQQLGAVAAQPARGVVRPVHPVAVPLPGRDTRQVAVPHKAVDLGQLDPGLGQRAAAVVGLVEKAELYAFSDLGEEGEVRAPSVPCRTERVWRSRPDTHSPPSAASRVAFGQRPTLPG